MSRFGVFKLNGVEYDLDDLTLDEVEEIENLNGGVAFSEVNFGSARGMKSSVYVLLKRTQPDISIDDVGSIKMIELLPATEEMPPLPPDEGAENQNGSDPGGSGVPLSHVSTSG